MSDAETCFRWISDPEVTRMLGLTRPIRSVEQERAWIAAILADSRQQRVFIIADENGRAIGSCGLRGIDEAQGIALLGIMVGEKSLWDRGYGTSATRALLAYAFGDLHLRQVRLSCHRDNHRALRCYEKAGFLPSRHEAVPRRLERPELRMAVTRERWQEVRPGSR